MAVPKKKPFETKAQYKKRLLDSGYSYSEAVAASSDSFFSGWGGGDSGGSSGGSDGGGCGGGD